MTREEAIEFGNMWLEVNEDAKDSSTYEFFQMAIKALAQEPVLDKIRAEIESREDKIRSSRDYDKAEYVAYIDAITDVLLIIDKYKAES